MTTSINKIMKNRKNKKGFSLIELIIVLVIMAILAAALVPTLVGYISQTRQSTAKNEASACVSAAQTITSSAFADPDGIYMGNASGRTITITFSASGGAASTEADFIAEIGSLAEVTGTISGVTIDANGKISGLTYACGNGETVTYNGTTYTVA